MTEKRLTDELVENLISHELYHHFEGTRTTVCCLVLSNGFSVIGEGSSISTENFDAGKGREVARKDAKAKIWKIHGYYLRQKLFQKKGAGA